jgi:hypothetical protein
MAWRRDPAKGISGANKPTTESQEPFSAARRMIELHHSIMEYGRDSIFYITLYTFVCYKERSFASNFSYPTFVMEGQRSLGGFLGFFLKVGVDWGSGLYAEKRYADWCMVVITCKDSVFDEMKMKHEIAERMQAERGSFSWSDLMNESPKILEWFDFSLVMATYVEMTMRIAVLPIGPDALQGMPNGLGTANVVVPALCSASRSSIWQKKALKEAVSSLLSYRAQRGQAIQYSWDL